MYLGFAFLALNIFFLTSCTKSNVNENPEISSGSLLENDTIPNAENNPERVAGTPPARSHTAMTYDSTRQVVIMFGGLNSIDYLNDTWEYDGNQWYQVNMLNAPPPRIRHKLAYDQNRQVTVLFGGEFWREEEQIIFGDLWEYDSHEWIQVQAAEMPSPRILFVMEYYPPEKAIFIAGGNDGGATSTSGTNGDAWLYDGHFWPGGIHIQESRNNDLLSLNFKMPYDEAIFDTKHGNLLLVMGSGETLEFNGLTWKPHLLQIDFSNEPGRYSEQGALSYDDNRGVIVLFGGLASKLGTDSYPVNETWEYDGEIWIQVHPTNPPTPRYGHTMVYDEARKVIVLFGGIDADGNRLNDTWEYDGTTWIEK